MKLKAAILEANKDYSIRLLKTVFFYGKISALPVFLAKLTDLSQVLIFYARQYLRLQYAAAMKMIIQFLFYLIVYSHTCC